MKKTFTVMAVVMAMALSTMASALAQNELAAASAGLSAAEESQAMFFVLPEDVNQPVQGHGWTPGSTVTVTVDGTDFEATAVVIADPDESEHDWLGVGDFNLGPVDFDFQPGQTVKVTSDDDPPVQKVHTVTALQVTEVNPATDTVAGTTDSAPGSIVEVVIHHQPVRRLVEVQADGSWAADFATAVDDGSEGRGEPFDIRPGTDGDAREFDAAGDATSINWHVPEVHKQRPERVEVCQVTPGNSDTIPTFYPDTDPRTFDPGKIIKVAQPAVPAFEARGGSATPGSGNNEYRTDAVGLANIRQSAEDNNLHVWDKANCFITRLPG